MTRYAFPIVGGPLDGQHATTDDFANSHTPYVRGEDGSWGPGPVTIPGGKFSDFRDDYVAYNLNGGWGGRRAARPSSMIWVHSSCISEGKITAKQAEARYGKDRP